MDGEALVQAAGGDAAAMFPGGQVREIRQAVMAVHPSLRESFAQACAAAIGPVQQVAAAVAMSILVQEEMQPNAAVGLFPINPTTGAAITPGTALTINTVYPLAPYQNTALSPIQNPVGTSISWNFVEGQRFFGVVTGQQDVAAGWCFAQGSLKFSLDAIGPLNGGDVSFAMFREDVVLGRQIIGVYQRRVILETVPFFVAAVLKAGSNTAMVEGVTMEYWDDRCTDSKIVQRHFQRRFGTEYFGSLVGDLLERAGAGLPAEAIVSHLRAQVGSAPTAPRFG